MILFSVICVVMVAIALAFVLPPLLAWWGWPTMQRILWPPKPEYQFQINVPAMGNALSFDFAFPVQQTPPPTANTSPLRAD